MEAKPEGCDTPYTLYHASIYDGHKPLAGFVQVVDHRMVAQHKRLFVCLFVCLPSYTERIQAIQV